MANVIPSKSTFKPVLARSGAEINAFLVFSLFGKIGIQFLDNFGRYTYFWGRLDVVVDY